MTSKEQFKVARTEERKQLKWAWYYYRIQMKKLKLLRKQTEVKGALAEMGIINKQIPVQIIPSKAQKIKVTVKETDK